MKFSVGQRLREARLNQGLDFPTLVARTKINEKLLRAIETDDRASFPGGFFYKSFVIQYAQALGVNAQEIEEELDRLIAAEPPLPLPGEADAPIRRPPPLVVSSRPKFGRVFASMAALAVVLVGCSGFYAWWRKIETRAATRPTMAQPTQAPAPVRAQAPARSPQPASPPPVQQPTPVSIAARPAAPNSADSSSTVSGILLELVARQETWLAVSSDGLMVFKGTLAPHESKTVEGKEFAKLRVNDPAAIEVKLNGKALGRLGPAGQYLVVVFTRDKYHILSSEKQGD